MPSEQWASRARAAAHGGAPTSEPRNLCRQVRALCECLPVAAKRRRVGARHSLARRLSGLIPPFAGRSRIILQGRGYCLHKSDDRRPLPRSDLRHGRCHGRERSGGADDDRFTDRNLRELTVGVSRMRDWPGNFTHFIQSPGQRSPIPF